MTGNEAVRFQGGILSLDESICWNDTQAYRELLKVANSLAGEPAPGAVAAAESLMSLYRGDFLAGEDKDAWTILIREQYRESICASSHYWELITKRLMSGRKRYGATRKAYASSPGMAHSAAPWSAAPEMPNRKLSSPLISFYCLYVKNDITEKG